MKKYLATIFCFLSLCLCFSTQASEANTPESVALSFTKKLYSGDAEGAMKLLLLNKRPNNDQTKIAMGQALNMTVLVNRRKVQTLGGISEITVKSIEYESAEGQNIDKNQVINGSKATVQIDVKFGFGSVEQRKWSLVKTRETGRWMIN